MINQSSLFLPQITWMCLFSQIALNVSILGHSADLPIVLNKIIAVDRLFLFIGLVTIASKFKCCICCLKSIKPATENPITIQEMVIDNVAQVRLGFFQNHIFSFTVADF